MSKVVHCKREPYDVYIGRPSKWGNPFSHIPGKGECLVDSREEAIACYELYITEFNPALLEQVGELSGKVLGCWCAPNSCHGDVLAKLADQATANRHHGQTEVSSVHD